MCIRKYNYRFEIFNKQSSQAKQQVIAQTEIQNNSEVSKMDGVCFCQKQRYANPT